MVKAGRNDPCPCGSGRKYKRCCGAPRQEGTEDLLYHRHRRASKEVDDLVLHWLTRYTDPRAADDLVELISGCSTEAEVEAWKASCDPAEVYFAAMLQAYALDLQPEQAVGFELDAPAPVWQLVLDRWGSRLSPFGGDVLRARGEAQLSFKEVVAVDRAAGRLLLRDRLTDAEEEIIDRELSKTATAGMTMLMSTYELEGGRWASLVGPRALDRVAGLRVEEGLRNRGRKVSAARLRRLVPDLLDIYHAATARGLPEIRNTDGDEVIWQRLTFTGELPAGELQRRLAEVLPAGEAVEAVEKDDDELRWVRLGEGAGGNVSLGVIRFEERGWVAEVNSVERATRLRRYLERVEGLTFRSLDTTELGLDGPAPGPSDDTSIDPREHPELLQALEKMISDHYSTWPDEPVPALDGATPREAVCTERGRRRVAALIDDMADRGEIGPGVSYDWNILRRELGLPER